MSAKMAGSMASMLTTVQHSPLEVVETAKQWEIQYSRFFTYVHLAFNSGGTWLSSSTPTAVLSLSADPSVSDFILTVSFHGKILVSSLSLSSSFSLRCTFYGLSDFRLCKYPRISYSISDQPRYFGDRVYIRGKPFDRVQNVAFDFRSVSTIARFR